MQTLNKNINKSIGIITIHFAINYGAVLQAYALQNFIKSEKKVDVRIINYITYKMQKDNAIFKHINHWKDLFSRLLILLNYYLLKRKENKFINFVNTYLKLTKRYSSYEQLASDPPLFFTYIVGSDQTFNVYSGDFKSYYLAFSSYLTKNKVAYAPSFGRFSVPEERKEQVISYLNDFNHISSRERKGSVLIQEMIGKEPQTVLDPVFLLNKETWQKLGVPIKNIHSPYILVYALIGYKKQSIIANKIKQLTRLPIIFVTHNIMLKYKSNNQIILDAGPLEFIWLFDNAQYVITDSFHGTAFSVIFNKNFYSCITFPAKADRIKNLLEILDLSNRIVSNATEITEKKLIINYKIPNKLMHNEIKNSKNYLHKALD